MQKANFFNAPAGVPLLLMLCMAGLALLQVQGQTTSDNLLFNGSFENGLQGWKLYSWKDHGQVKLDEVERYNGMPSLQIENSSDGESWASQCIRVTPHSRYRISGFIKTRGIQSQFPNSQSGASLGLVGTAERSHDLIDSPRWQRVAYEFNTGERTEIEVGPRLGTYTKVSGAAWFAEIALENLDLVNTKGAASASKVHNSSRELAPWGKTCDPDGDCQFYVAGGSLLISVPGAGNPHDLAADVNRVNAPRVLQSVRGDFTIQVQTDGRFSPGDESTLPGRTGYNGAALIAMVDEQNVVTLARAVLQQAGGEAQPYANFEIRVSGQLQRLGLTSDHPLPIAGPIYLRLERRGNKFLGAVSCDGVNWDVLEPKDVPAEWPKDLQVGVAAISTSKEEFNPRFSKLQIVK